MTYNTSANSNPRGGIDVGVQGSMDSAQYHYPNQHPQSLQTLSNRFLVLGDAARWVQMLV